MKASFGNEEDEGWRPFRADSPVFSPGGTLDWQALPSNYGSRLTVPRVIGPASSTTRLPEEDGNIWPAPEPPRTILTDPDAVARGIPNFQPQGRPLQSAYPSGQYRGWWAV